MLCFTCHKNIYIWCSSLIFLFYITPNGNIRNSSRRNRHIESQLIRRITIRLNKPMVKNLCQLTFVLIHILFHNSDELIIILHAKVLLFLERAT